MKIKGLLSLLLVIVMLFTVCGCSGGKGDDSKDKDKVSVSDMVKEGTTPIEEGLDFGGKTVTYAIGLPLSSTMQRQLISFEKKYNCKVETDLLGFLDYVQILASRMAGGKTYDIIQLEGIRFPSIAISNFVEPLEDVITTADWAGDDYTKGGFVKDETMKFVWGEHLYAVVCSQGEFSSKVGYLAYNKKIFEAAGAEDPRELYEQGKWNWNTFEEAAKKIRDNTDSHITGYRHIDTVLGYNGAGTYDFSDPDNPKSNLTAPENINKYTFLQKLLTGNDPLVIIDGDHTPTTFFEGKIAMYPCAVFELYDNYCMGENIEASNAFDKSLDNMGIVPCLLGPDNKDGIRPITSCMYGIAAGSGTSDPKIAMAFAKHSSTFSTVARDGDYKYNEADTKLLLELQNEKKTGLSHEFSDGSTSVSELLNQFKHDVQEGGDIAQLVATYDAQIQNCIDVMMSQQ